GTIRWRGWRLPLVAFAPLIGQGAEQGGLGHKVVVLKSLRGQPTMPYFALLTKGLPRLVTVSRDRLEAAGDADADGQAQIGARPVRALARPLRRLQPRWAGGAVRRLRLRGCFVCATCASAWWRSVLQRVPR